MSDDVQNGVRQGGKAMPKKIGYVIFFHVVCWILVALPPIIFVPQNIPQDAVMYLVRLSMPVFMCIIFYVNYLWLVPRYFVEHKTNVYLAVNVVVIIFFAVCQQKSVDIMHLREMAAGLVRPEAEKEPPLLEIVFAFIIRNVFSFILSAAVATMMRLALKWQSAEDARRELEIKKTEAELKNLRNQINPHFLLNTLNNIYALISFNQEKAQQAVLSLSSLLREMLYGGQDNVVNLKDEVKFIENYVDLMRLRLSKNVRVDVDMNVSPQTDVFIAPFITISLVENAFKHGVSLTQPSFISIRIHADKMRIECEIKNSNHPKNSSDKSGHGIGLRQVAQRLDLAYKDKYEWSKGVDEQNDIYFSKIVIYDTQMCNNR